ncbi:DUF4348 domain-containing protein [Bacteroides sp. 214]|uniref:DUF4348 domain-containing protein n=1 Tax=Bacteroides sp. 214 TaxID=2302935 RepID=UPI0013D2E175|nr:DUF4348 domain-containing protein [Bacteroides sp. 214]NDW11892.1 DUF4348 domain-containing protein [Bacteroides sp. 214]
MRRFAIYILSVLLFFSCDSKKKEKESTTTPSVIEEVDTVVVPVDTIPEKEDIYDELIPKPAPPKNENFGDFIIAFAFDEEQQIDRTLFPLYYYDEDSTYTIDKECFQTDTLFFDRSYYTIILDEEGELDMLEDTVHTSIQMEWINLKTLEARKYYFQRLSGRWMLEAINQRVFELGMNRDFVEFFYKFTNDSLFQLKHTHIPLEFVTTDPDDDFSVIQATIDEDQWLAFRPILPKERITNIYYGQKIDQRSGHKIVQLKGIANGFENTLFFRRKGKSWQLYKFEDTSN